MQYNQSPIFTLIRLLEAGQAGATRARHDRAVRTERRTGRARIRICVYKVRTSRAREEARRGHSGAGVRVSARGRNAPEPIRRCPPQPGCGVRRSRRRSRRVVRSFPGILWSAMWPTLAHEAGSPAAIGPCDRIARGLLRPPCGALTDGAGRVRWAGRGGQGCRGGRRGRRWRTGGPRCSPSRCSSSLPPPSPTTTRAHTPRPEAPDCSRGRSLSGPAGGRGCSTDLAGDVHTGRRRRGAHAGRGELRTTVVVVGGETGGGRQAVGMPPLQSWGQRCWTGGGCGRRLREAAA
jgi:hypothetical protein